MNDSLHERLRRAADDTEHPLTTDITDLLGRARHERSRRRTLTARAAVLTAAALIGTTLGVRAVLPDDSRPAAQEEPRSTTPTSADVPLHEGDIVRRCLPQLEKYEELPQYEGTGDTPARQWRIPRERDYRAGDLVALQDRRGSRNRVLCVVPEAGHEHDEVPFSAYEPAASRPAAVAQRCSEEFLPQADLDFRTGEFLGHPDRQMPDLRRATVAAVDSAGPVLEVLLDLGGKHFACALSPVTWDAGPFGVGRTAPEGYAIWVQGSATGASGKSIVDEDATYYYAAGTMPKDAARIEVTLVTGSTFTVPVTDGNYAFVHKEPGTGGVVSYDYRVLDVRGAVLHEGTDRM
ncbi:hypothetical protein ncot_10700 [Nocardioides sp. JQ2195]|uniref:hypothetical protein n=1 Tax=Nocardioides sp. JQ2195 TaxID=2592334 RepID=UPI00143E61E5|nr:hypothetical protein [Nocardioides sp. JQ2195]QIX27009.1 hypothetical protein ncot_10700 [Nocardioides sp. JQ2195]